MEENSVAEVDYELLALDAKVRLILAKASTQRTYDDLTILKQRISKMDYMKRVFSSLHPRQIDEVCLNMNLELFLEDQYVFHQGDPGDKFYLVLTGSCDVIISQKVGNTLNADGALEDVYAEKVVFTCTGGQHFGERALEFDEPRGASIKSTCVTELISITQHAYRKILKSTFDVATVDTTSKANAIRVLSKPRDKRASTDIQAVAVYLSKHIPFFKKMDHEQQLEICRVCELVNVWGKTVLFKQGSVGEAFYIILTGSVDIIVTTTDEEGNPKDMHIQSLYTGDTFGERALESESHLRSATVVTSDSHTDLILLGRDDYIRIISALREGMSREKVKLLRKTQLFSHLDLKYIQDMAKYMEMRIYRYNNVLFRGGDNMRAIYFIQKGECHVQRTMTLTNGEKVNVDHGRLGPGGVIGEKCATVDSVFEEIKFDETAFASTYCIAFVMTKTDVFNGLKQTTRDAMKEAILNFVHPHTKLWDVTPIRMNEDDYLISKAWRKFRTDFIDNPKHQNILDHYKSPHADEYYDANELAQNSTNSIGVLSAKESQSLTDSEKSHKLPAMKSIASVSSLGGKSRKFSVATPVENSEEMRIRQSLMSGSVNNKQVTNKMKFAYNSRTMASVTLRLPFSLIQIHRSKATGQMFRSGQRSLRCFLRICGVMASGGEAKLAAEAQMLNFDVKMKSVQSNEVFSSTLHWQRFNGFDNMPMQNTDHFIVYCRSVPVEFASFTPDVDMLTLEYPPSCKQKGQRFACLSVHELKSQHNDFKVTMNPSILLPPSPTRLNSSGKQQIHHNFDADNVLNSLYSKEVAWVAEVHCVCLTRIDCLRFGVLALPTNAVPYGCKAVVLPLFSWHPINQELIDACNCNRFKERAIDELKGGGICHTLEEMVDEEDQDAIMNPEKRRLGGGSETFATEELKHALLASGMGNASRYDNKKDKHKSVKEMSDDDSMGSLGSKVKLLNKEINTKIIVDEVNKRASARAHSPTTGGGITQFLSVHDHAASSALVGNNVNAGNQKGKGSPVKTRVAEDVNLEKSRALLNLVESRRKILQMNDELCEQERQMEERLQVQQKEVIKQNENLLLINPKQAEKQRMSRQSKNQQAKANDAYAAEMLVLSKKRVEILEALQAAPIRKTPDALNLGKKHSYGPGYDGIGDDKKGGRGKSILPYLQARLDILDEICFTHDK